MVETISKEQIGWLSGILDGEGCISVGWRKYKKGQNNHKYERCTLYIFLAVSSSDARIIRRVSELFKVLNVGFYYTTAKTKYNYKSNTQDVWCMNIYVSGKKSTEKVLELVLPYLTRLREQAIRTLELIDYRRSLGYLPSKSTRLKLKDMPKIKWYVNEISRLKKEKPILPSETKRKANQILEFD